jgi:hypothetical protein
MGRVLGTNKLPFAPWHDIVAALNGHLEDRVAASIPQL